jgi:hypothetical protein
VFRPLGLELDTVAGQGLSMDFARTAAGSFQFVAIEPGQADYLPGQVG